MYRTATEDCAGEVKREDPHKVSAEVPQCIAQADLASDVVLNNVPADNIKRLLIGSRLYVRACSTDNCVVCPLGRSGDGTQRGTFSALIDEAGRIKYHVIGLSETKRKEPLSCTWTDGISVFLGARKTNSTSGGVGFLVSPHFSKHVKSVRFHGHRLVILIAYLSKDSQVTIIQAYAPTADSDEEQYDNFYEQLEELVRRQRGYVVVMGDFNDRVGSRKYGEIFIVSHSAEERTEAGERLASFCELHHPTMAIVSPQSTTEKMGSYLAEWTKLSRNRPHFVQSQNHDGCGGCPFFRH
uniref:Craniofacial development protein 2-like n=1 Tax=Haemonchus contortus TaxID=6289 RepID=A0A7I4YPZ0_HAECO